MPCLCAAGSKTDSKEESTIESRSTPPADEAKEGSRTSLLAAEAEDNADDQALEDAVPSSLEGKADGLLPDEEPNTTSQPAGLNTDTHLTADMGDGSSA